MKRAVHLYFTLAGLEGVAAFAAFAAMPSDPANAWILGFSRSRLLLMAMVAGATLILGGLSWKAWRDAAWGERLGHRLQSWLEHPRLYTAILILSGLLALVGFYAHDLSNQLTDNLVRVRLERLAPLVAWLALVSLQTLIALPSLRFGAERERVKLSRIVLKAALITLLAFLALAAVMGLTRLGLEPDRVGWDNPGAPLLPVQVMLAALAGLGIWGLIILLGKAWKRLGGVSFLGGRFVMLDVVLCLVIWVTAFGVWALEPAAAVYFSPQPQPPNFEVYPYSDAGLHDIAGQNLILGEGYKPVAEKPLYSMLLGLAHLVVGQKYTGVIGLQMAFLAAFPVLAYLLGKLLHTRYSGLIAAGLLILREQNTLALSHKIRVSHSKLLMTDLPAALGMALFVFLLLWWLKKGEQRRVGALLAGGALGVLLLVRSQAIILIAVVLLGLVVMQWGKWRRLVENGALFGLGVALAFVPWMWRNFVITGQFGYSQPNQALYMAKQYSLTPEDADPGFPADATREDYVELGFGKALAFAKEYPGVVANFITRHFLRNIVSTVLIFPFQPTDVAYGNHGPPGVGVDPFVWAECCSLDTYLDRVPYWAEWEGALAAGTQIPILFNLAILALGVGVAWRRMRWAGLLPMAIFLAYDLSVAIARVSGWRLILPVDWIAILYYCLGLGQLVLWGLAFLRNKNFEAEVVQEGSTVSKFPWKAALGFGALIMAIGASVPLAEGLFPARYTQPSKVEALAMLEEQNPDMALDRGAFLADEDAVVLVGRALYPKFYLRNQGEPGGKWPGYVIEERSRLAFYLAGPENAYVVLPVDFPPIPFPNGADVLVFGCQVEGHVEASIVLLIGEINGVYTRVGEAESTCSGLITR